MRQGFALEQNPACPGGFHWRPIHVIQQSLHQVARRREVLQPLLILNADRRATEFIRQTRRGDVHLALLQRLRFGQFRFFVFAPTEGHALLDQPIEHRSGFLVADLLHRRKQRGLAEPLLKDAGRMQ